MSVIVLNEKLLVGEGNERLCFINPNNKERVIKITKKNVNGREQNKIDSMYYSFLVKQGRQIDHIPRCYGWVKTSRGEGLEFDRAMNYDHSQAMTLERAVLDRKIGKTELHPLMQSLKHYLFKNRVIFYDVGPSNVILERVSQDKWKLVVVDGLGARRLGLKFWFHQKLRLLPAYKARKQWRKFEHMVDGLWARRP